MRDVALIIVFLSASAYSGVFAKTKEPKTYSEQGSVVATKIREQSATTDVYTDNEGKTQGGSSYVRRLPVYRIETDTKFYELEGRRKQILALGDTIRFRMEKKWAYVQQGDKEQRFRVVGVQLKQSK